jgi:anti-anti-sigma factor
MSHRFIQNSAPSKPPPYLPGPGDCLPGALSIGLYEHPAGWVVVIVGELDIATAGVLTGRLDQPDGAARPHVVADLSGLGFCDWSGLAALLRIRERAVGQGGWLRLCAPAAAMRKLLRITGQSKVLRCYPGIDEAFAGPSDATRETDAA